jgi:hypothetical protein
VNLILLHKDIQRFYSFQSKFLLNKKENKTLDTSLKIRNLKNFSKKIKEEIIFELKKIKISNKYKFLLQSNKQKIKKNLFETYLREENYNKILFKYLLELNSKNNGNYEIQLLIRLILDNFRSELYFKVLFYNYLLSVLYSDYGIHNVFEFFHLPKFVKKFKNFYRQNKNSFGNYYYNSGRILTGSEIVPSLFGRRKFDYKYKNGKDYFYIKKNNLKKIKTKDLTKYLSQSRFFDKEGRNLDFTKDEDLILLDYYHQKVREEYLGSYKWANEFFLYRNTKYFFKKDDIKIYREYSPKNLKPQRLDIYFEFNKKKIAFEYQGEQHFKPIPFFGGAQALKKRKRLDLKKENICKKLNIILIKFNYNESITTTAIEKKLRENKIIK